MNFTKIVVGKSIIFKKNWIHIKILYLFIKIDFFRLVKYNNK